MTELSCLQGLKLPNVWLIVETLLVHVLVGVTSSRIDHGKSGVCKNVLLAIETLIRRCFFIFIDRLF